MAIRTRLENVESVRHPVGPETTNSGPYTNCKLPHRFNKWSNWAFLKKKIKIKK